MKHDAALVKMLRDKGFTENLEEAQEWNETIYVRSHNDDTRMQVKVCTGIPVGRKRATLRVTQVRIYTLLVTGVKTYPIGRFEPVIKQGDEIVFLGEVLKTMRAAYDRGSQWLVEKGGNRNASNGATSNPSAPRFQGGYIELDTMPTTPLDKV